MNNYGQYEDYLVNIMENGTDKSDRTGTGTRSVFGSQMRFDLSEGFPLVTTKRVPLKSVIVELLWFLRGDTNVKWLQENGCTIWDSWADDIGDLGPIYSRQWVNWNGSGINQIADVVEGIKKSPDGRRHIVSAWNVEEIGDMALPPCHCLFQFYVANGKLSCQLYQRSADSFLGVAFNIASYSLLTMMVAQQCDLQLGEFIWTGGDCHIYSNHFEQVDLLLSRDLRPFPTMKLARRPDSIFEYKLEDFILEGYDPHPAIKAPVAV